MPPPATACSMPPSRGGQGARRPRQCRGRAWALHLHHARQSSTARPSRWRSARKAPPPCWRARSKPCSSPASRQSWRARASAPQGLRDTVAKTVCRSPRPPPSLGAAAARSLPPRRPERCGGRGRPHPRRRTPCGRIGGPCPGARARRPDRLRPRRSRISSRSRPCSACRRPTCWSSTAW